MLKFAMPIGLIFSIWLFVNSILNKSVPASLYLPEYKKSSTPIRYYISLLFILALVALCTFGTLDQTFGVSLL